MGYAYEIWTYDKAEDFCEKVYQYALGNEGCYTLGGAAVECGEYEEVIIYLQKKFNKEFQSIKKAKEVIKQRCINKGMDGKTNPTMTIFNLVNNFDMVNTNTKSDITTKGKELNTQINLNGLTFEQLKELTKGADNQGSEEGASEA